MGHLISIAVFDSWSWGHRFNSWLFHCHVI